MKRISLIFAAALALAGLSAKAADSLTMADFNHKIKLMVDGYTGTETLQNFPVLVRVSETRIPSFRFADMSAKNVNGKAMGYDLAFFAEDGTRLACDQDTWDIDKTVGNTGEQLVWVKLPQMKQGTKFYMCYNVADGVYVTNDNPWDDYVGVWHLNETGGKTNIFDATANGLNGKALADNGEAVSSGKIGHRCDERSPAEGRCRFARQGLPCLFLDDGWHQYRRRFEVGQSSWASQGRLWLFMGIRICRR